MSVAADTQETRLNFAAAGPTTRRVTKTAVAGRMLGVVAGLGSAAGYDLTRALADAVEQRTLLDAGRTLITEAAALTAAAGFRLATLFDEADIVWSAFLAAAPTEPGAPAAGLTLTGYIDSGALTFHAEDIAVTDEVQCLVLGASHSWLRRHDTRLGASLDLAAALTRDPDAPTSIAVGNATEATAARLITTALSRPGDAAAPPWWPPEVPVASGPVTTTTLRW